MSEFVLETAPQHIDVLTCEDWEKNYSSKYDTLKCKVAAIVTFTTTANPHTESIAHGLGYTPAFVALIKGSGTSYFPIPFSNVFSDLTGVLTVQAYANATTLNFKITGTIGTNVMIKYFIFYNQLD